MTTNLEEKVKELEHKNAMLNMDIDSFKALYESYKTKVEVNL